MKDKNTNLGDGFHCFFHYLIKDWIYPLLLLGNLAFLSNFKMHDNGVLGFIMAILIICYVNSYKEKD